MTVEIKLQDSFVGEATFDLESNDIYIMLGGPREDWYPVLLQAQSQLRSRPYERDLVFPCNCELIVPHGSNHQLIVTWAYPPRPNRLRLRFYENEDRWALFGPITTMRNFLKKRGLLD